MPDAAESCVNRQSSWAARCRPAAHLGMGEAGSLLAHRSTALATLVELHGDSRKTKQLVQRTCARLRTCSGDRSAILMLVEHLAGIGLGDGVPAFPGDVEDDEGDDKADDRVGEVQPEGNH